MFPPTVSSHECWVADCSRCEGRPRQMICRPVQFLYVERQASKYQLILYQDGGCRPGDSTRLDTSRHHLLVFGHTAQLTQGTPAHNAVHCQVRQVDLASGRSLGGDWRRRPGRPRACWTNQLHNDTGSVSANLWRQAILQDHGGAMRLSKLAMR